MGALVVKLPAALVQRATAVGREAKKLHLGRTQTPRYCAAAWGVIVDVHPEWAQYRDAFVAAATKERG